MAGQSRTLDSVVKRIRSRTFSDPNDLAREIAAGIAALARQPSFVRGLSRGTIADIQGGTSLGVGDPSAANISGVLVQNQQTGLPPNVGSGLKVRRQARIETRVRDVPAMVTADAGEGDTSVSVVIVGSNVLKSNDSITGIETVGDPLTVMADAGMSPSLVEGEEIEAVTSGSPFVAPGSNGIQPPVEGQTLFVTLAEQWEVVTSWTVRYRKNIPVVTRVLKSRTCTITNGLVNVVT